MAVLLKGGSAPLPTGLSTPVGGFAYRVVFKRSDTFFRFLRFARVRVVAILGSSLMMRSAKAIITPLSHKFDKRGRPL